MIKFFISLFLIFITNISYTKEINVLTDEQVENFLPKYLDLNNLWYGIYVTDGKDFHQKIGYWNVSHEIINSENYPKFKNQVSKKYLTKNKNLILEKSSMNIKIFVGEKSEISEISTELIFQKFPPYNLLYERFNDGSLITESFREDNNMKVELYDGINVETKILKNFRYSLNDYLNTFVFTLDNYSKVGTKINSNLFSEGKFSIQEYTLSNKVTKMIQGVNYNYYILDIITYEDDSEIFTQTFVDSKNLLPISINMPDYQIEIRLEDKKTAIDFGIQQDLYVLSSIPLDRDYISLILSENKFVENIFLEIQGDYQDNFPNSFQQEVINKGNKNYLVISNFYSDSKYGIYEYVSEGEINDNLNKKDFDPIDDPDIIKIARKETAGIENNYDKVVKLLKFVSDYIEDSYSIKTAETVYEIIDSKVGDCTEHAFLFNVLARSIGIPSRIVNGFAYDPVTKSYVGHTWNEVVIDNYWLAVDPTWNEVSVFGHIKQNDDKFNFINNLKFKLSKIEFTNGEELIF